LLAPVAVAFVSGVRPVPSAFTRQMLKTEFALRASVPSSLRWETKATLEPSGDHCGLRESAPNAVTLVRNLRPVPSALTRQAFRVLFKFTASVPSSLRKDSNTTLAPSGDHRGKKLSAPLAVAVVSGVSPVPSELTRQML